MKKGPEYYQHIIIVDWLRKLHKDIPFWHTANERKTYGSQGNDLKKMGVLSGVSDFIFPRGNDKWKGLCIELKIKPNKPLPTQVEFMNMMINEGYCGKFCYGADESIDIIKKFYCLKL